MNDTISGVLNGKKTPWILVAVMGSALTGLGGAYISEGRIAAHVAQPSHPQESIRREALERLLAADLRNIKEDIVDIKLELQALRLEGK